VEAGCVLQAVQEQARSVGRLFPLSLAAEGSCTIGGNLATNAGGTQVLRYGNARELCLGLEVVTAEGEVWDGLSGLRKDNTGYDLRDLFIGSEGTLGIITEVTLRLMPAQNPLSVVVASFGSVEAAIDAVLGVTARLRPAMLEFMDSVAINAVEDTLRMDLDRDAAAMLVAASDERGRAGSEDAEMMAAVFAQNGAKEVFSTDDPDEGEAFVAARRFCIPAVENKGSLLLEDVGVPLPALGELVTGIARIADERDLMISVIAHAGDGNTHPLLVFDPADVAMAERAQLAYGEIMDLAVGLGGTITGEHGIGRLKRPWLEGYLGPEVMDLNRRIKQALDPDGILNPGSGI
jgi:glycolate oxidase